MKVLFCCFSFIGHMLELSCLEVHLQPNLTYSLSSNFSLMTFLQPVRETQTIMGIFLNHSNFQNFTRICQDIISEFKMCSLCLVCESKGNVDLISQEQTSEGKCKGKVRIKFIKDKWPYSVKKLLKIYSKIQFSGIEALSGVAFDEWLARLWDITLHWFTLSYQKQNIYS